MKKTIKTFMIFIGILSLISCNTPLNENVEKTSNNETEIIDNDEKNTENTNDEDESNETEVNDDTESEKDNTDEEITNDENEDEKDNTDEEIIDDDTESESEKDNTDEEITNDENENEDEKDNTDEENNGTLNYLFSENTLLCDFDYVIYYNNKITNWKFYTSSNSTHAQITVNNSFNIRIEITANTITVTRGFGCFKNVVINDIKINDNVITIKVSQ